MFASLLPLTDSNLGETSDDLERSTACLYYFFPHVTSGFQQLI